MKLYVHIILAFLFLSESLYSQEEKKIEIVNANYSYYDASINPDMRRLVDSVIFKLKNTTMYCDSAWHYFKDNAFKAFSNIHINQGDTINLYGNKLDYIGDDQKIFIQGNVVLKDEEMQLNTEKLYYNLNSKKAHYYTGANIINGENKLYSKKGDYLSEQKILLFKQDVQLENPKYIINSDTLKYNVESEISFFVGPTKIISENNFIYCENGWYNTQTDISQFNKNAYLWSEDQRLSGDSLYYDRNKGYGLAIKKVEILDTLNNYILTGEWAEHFENLDSSIITQNTLLTLIMDQDSLFLHGDTIKGAIDKNGKKYLKAYNNVKFFSDDLQGKCNYIIHNIPDSTIHMYDLPILWNNEQQLSGNDIILQLSNNQLERLNIIENSFIASKGTNMLFNQIKGKEMLGYFNNNTLYKIDVIGNGETIYILKDNKDKINGVNTVSCSEMKIYIINNNIQRISFKNNPDANLYPLEKLPKEWQILKGFKWRESERPLKFSDIF